MKKSVFIISGLVIAAAVITVTIIKKRGTIQKTEYKTAVIHRGAIEMVISSTGSLNPVSTIEVGTQVSGTIVKVNADYNDVVTKGQIVAEIDKEPLLNKLNQVKASYLRNEALYKQAQTKYNRMVPLHEKQLVSDDEFMGVETDYYAQKAALEGARVDVETARNNLTYAIIKSPVNGTVISRSVEVGQTVAANFSAPTLFIIAEDLQKMQILADVDESDIGKIKVDQDVSFTVPAYPERKFTGKVSQIRLQPQTSQSVVTYTVVIKASNADGVLLPGMTANVDFITEKVDNVLLVPSAALRFKPSELQLAKLRALRKERNVGDRGEPPPPSRDSANAGSIKGPGSRDSVSKSDRGVIWVLENGGEIRPEFVKVGLTDGTDVEIRGRSVKEDVQVVTGIIEKKKNRKQTESRSLFGPPKMQSSSGKRSSAGGPPHGGF
ncbi:MAG TPA: efflux RND transporter periplasmic adaptor subunit [Chitinispirillaceae bacterium]|nr:efflux RND transporter periplasmic adaptor subunit [Chitinispirillaceae bacterium]